MGILIVRPSVNEKEEIIKLFRKTITYAFQQDGLSDRLNDRENEISKQIDFLNRDFNSNGKDIYFLIAKIDGKIVGTIAKSSPNTIIVANINEDLSRIPEVSSVYVLPEFQNQGIGSKLFNSIIEYFKKENSKSFVMDGGYKKSQIFWINKVGKPTIILKDYWGKDLDHMIWKLNLSSYY